MDTIIEGSNVTIQEIMDLLPHRYPFLMVDRLVEIDGEETAIGIKNCTATEPWFTGHFPDMPIFPGVLIIEAIAQMAAILVLHNAKINNQKFKYDRVYLTSVDKVRFRHPIMPGDQMRVRLQKRRKRNLTYKFKGEVFVGDTLCAEGEVTSVNYAEPQDALPK